MNGEDGLVGDVTAINRAAAEALEWDRLVELASAGARSEPGKAALLRLKEPEAWAPDAATARGLQEETQEAVALLAKDALWGPLSSLSDPFPLFDSLRRESVLEASDLATLRGWLHAFDAWAEFPRQSLAGRRFVRALGDVSDPRDPLRVILPILTDSGEVSENASPRLHGLHAEIRAVQAEISRAMEKLLKDYWDKGVLQENYSDRRDGRWVIPVKISQQRHVEGIVHEASVSRQTVFVEPREIEVLNNRLRRAQNDLSQEIYEILKAASAKLAPHEGDMSRSAGVLVHWDAVQARARFASKFGGKPVEVTEGRAFVLSYCAHPLLWWSLPDPAQVIRNDIEIEPPARALVISGPNTGGKTVLLKTIGLAALSARTGFPFPGAGRLSVPFVDTVFVDLGDPQSIERRLSSFSGHVLRFREVLETITPRSLVLIDELNTATDPEEGAALARAFVEAVIEGTSADEYAVLVATTHDPHLKLFAASDKRLANTSMEFDEEKLEPTYRLARGIPGRSRALEIAERLGLPRHVLDKAKGYLSDAHKDLEGLLGRLEADSRETAKLRRQAEAMKAEAERLREEWLERIERSVSEAVDRARQKIKGLLEQAEDEVRSVSRRIESSRTRKGVSEEREKIGSFFDRVKAKVETALEEESPEIAGELKKRREERAKDAPAAEAPAAAPSGPVAVGSIVRVPKWKSVGRVVEANGGKLRVQLGAGGLTGKGPAGLMVVTVSPADTEAVPQEELERLLPRGSIGAGGAIKTRVEISAAGPSEPVPDQIDLRGVRLDEAMSALQTYLDGAFRAGRREARIVHGLGTGAIREGTRKLLGTLPYVKTFRDGGAGQGGAGATVVEFEGR